MPVLPRPAQPTHQLPGAFFTSLATPSVGSVDTAVWEVRLAPGHPGTPHQLTRQEVFIVIEGHGVAQLAGERFSLSAGDVIIVPVHTPFLLEATGEQDFVAMCCLPVGGQGIVGSGEPFTPPWAE